MRISDWSSDVCSSDLVDVAHDDAVRVDELGAEDQAAHLDRVRRALRRGDRAHEPFVRPFEMGIDHLQMPLVHRQVDGLADGAAGMRSEEHTSELQSLMRISYAVFCLKKKTEKQVTRTQQWRIEDYRTNN